MYSHPTNLLLITLPRGAEPPAYYCRMPCVSRRERGKEGFSAVLCRVRRTMRDKKKRLVRRGLLLKLQNAVFHCPPPPSPPPPPPPPVLNLQRRQNRRRRLWLLALYYESGQMEIFY